MAKAGKQVTLDYPEWINRTFWTLYEAAALLIGAAPVAGAKTPKDVLSGLKPDDAKAQFNTVYSNLKDGIDLWAKDKKDPRALDYVKARALGNPYGLHRVRPHHVIAWAKHMDLVIPPALAQAWRKESARGDTELTLRERTTLLNIIGGLLELMLDQPSPGKPKTVFENETAIKAALVSRYSGKPGLSQRSLDDKFPKASRSLIGT